MDNGKVTQARVVVFVVSRWNLTFTDDGTMGESYWLISEAEYTAYCVKILFHFSFLF
jgi:hypothetical protein